MKLSDDELDTLRLGALLHDIGKIGISDAVLRKPGALTPEEFAVIETHPSVGARILRSVHFLAPHLPIVELHHERPDGQGYPHRLRGDEIPLLARIVHVADAFDAITSARAYRPARGSPEALRELWRCAGSQFDAEVVHALAAAMPAIELAPHEDVRALTSITAPRLVVSVGGRRASCARLPRDHAFITKITKTRRHEEDFWVCFFVVFVIFVAIVIDRDIAFDRRSSRARPQPQPNPFSPNTPPSNSPALSPHRLRHLMTRSSCSMPRRQCG